MKVFVSWSGGKDCMFALYRKLVEQHDEVVSLLNMCEANGQESRSHGLSRDLIAAQAKAMNIPLLQKSISKDGYRQAYVEAVEELKEHGVTGGVFGDIYLQAHRDWLEELCDEVGIMPIFPLWGDDTAYLLKSFINNGFKAVTVAINKEKLSDEWLDRDLDTGFYNDITALEGIDACAEQGEYHTFVYDGPIFKHPVPIVKSECYDKAKNKYIRLELKEK